MLEKQNKTILIGGDKMKNIKRSAWTNDKRRTLESLLKKGFRISSISEAIGISSTSIYKEIRRGVSEDEYAKGRYIMYSANKSINKQIDEIKALLEGEE